jgi:hypothetical protein
MAGEEKRMREVRSLSLLTSAIHCHPQCSCSLYTLYLFTCVQVKALETEVEQLKKKAGGLSKERLLREKEIKKLQAQKDTKAREDKGCNAGRGGRQGQEESKGVVKKNAMFPRVAMRCVVTWAYMHACTQSPAALSAKEEMSRIQRRIKAGEKEEASLRAKAAEQKKTLAKLERELAKVQEGEGTQVGKNCMHGDACIGTKGEGWSGRGEGAQLSLES